GASTADARPIDGAAAKHVPPGSHYGLRRQSASSTSFGKETLTQEQSPCTRAIPRAGEGVPCNPESGGPAGAPGGTPAVGRAQLLVVATALVIALIVVVVSLVVVALGRGGRGASAEVQAERDLAADDRRGQRQPGRKWQRERLPVHRDRDGPRAHARHRGLDRDVAGLADRLRGLLRER